MADGDRTLRLRIDSRVLVLEVFELSEARARILRPEDGMDPVVERFNTRRVRLLEVVTWRLP